MSRRNPKLSPFDVRQLRNHAAQRRHAQAIRLEAIALLRATPTVKQYALQMGISESHATRIINRKAYKWVRE